MQGVHGQAHAVQVHAAGHRADDRRLIGFLIHGALSGGKPGVVPEPAGMLGCLLAVEFRAAAGFAVGAQAPQRGDVTGVTVSPGGKHRMCRGDRDAPVRGAGREFRAPAGDGLRAGPDRGRGRLPCLPGGLTGLFPRPGAGRPRPPGCLAGPGPRPAGLVPALLLQLRRGQDLTPGRQLSCPPAQQVIGQVMVNQAADPPYRFLRRAGVEPRPLVLRAAQRLQYPLRAARRPLPDRGERVTPGQPRGHRRRDHARQAEPYPPPVPRIRQLPQPPPQRGDHRGDRRIIHPGGLPGSRPDRSGQQAGHRHGAHRHGAHRRGRHRRITGRHAGTRGKHLRSSGRLDGQRSHLPDGDLQPIPVLPGLRCSSPARHAVSGQIPLISPATGIPDPANIPGTPAPPARYRQSRPPGHQKAPGTPITQRNRSRDPVSHPPSHLLCRDPGVRS
jgi:hypothetical protein